MKIRLLKTFEEENNFNNVIVPLSIDVEEVVFVYHHDVNKRKIENCYKVLKKYKDIKITFKKIKEKDVEKLINNNTTIDISAAKYLSIVLYEYALKKGCNIIYYDEEEKVIKKYKDHEVVTSDIFRLKIEDIIKIGGGEIQDNLHKPVEKKETISLIYKTIENVSNNYEQFTNFVSRINNYISNNNHQKCTYNLNESVIKKIKNDDAYLKFKNLNLFKIENNKLKFFNKEIRECFMVSGAFLENYIYHKLLDSKVFDDVKMSAVIIFNNEQFKYPVTCELDCLVLKNNNLLFTSIKSNKVDTDDLNEIKIHNVMFGNLQSKPVICINNDLGKKRPSIYAKAEELSVYVVDTDDLIDNKIVSKFLSIIDGTYKYEKI